MSDLPTPITRSEQYLASIAGEAPTLPVPITREERYLAKIAGEDVDIPPAPITRTEQYLAAIVEGGGGGGVEVESLSVTENGTYTAEEGKAYSPVSVAVPNSYAAADEGKVVSNGALVEQTSDSVTENGTVDTTLINSLVVNVPQGGGGGDLAEEKDVNFIDYDGTLLYSYTAAEFANLTELPANPSHDGLTAQGWNWTLADAKTYVAAMGMLWVGQQYITSDGKTHIYIELQEGMTSPKLGLYGFGTVSVDWGDGTPESTLTLSGSTQYTDFHKYASHGKYEIAISVVSGNAVSFSGASYVSNVLAGADDNETSVYADAIFAIRLGNVVNVGQFGIGRMHNLRYITIPKTATLYSGTLPYDNYTLKGLVLSSAQTGIDGSGNDGLRRLSLPHGLTTFKWKRFSNLRVSVPDTVQTYVGQHNYTGNIKLPQGIKTLENYAFGNSPRYTIVDIPSTVTNIKSYAFSGSYGLRELWLNPTTPPTLASGAFYQLVTACVLYIPFASLAAYLTASNYPAPATYTYIGFATYNSGVTLPTQDSTEAYNVVWYASKDDAIAQTNPITQGNGKEVYCRYTAV